MSAKKILPDWYKKIPAFNSKNTQSDNDKLKNLSLKACMPFFDATTGGYIQKTWSDIHIAYKGENIVCTLAQDPMIMTWRDKVSIKLNNNYYPVEFVWQKQWTAQLPKGYSLLITHPHNRLDLPFHTLSGLVDADSFYPSMVGNIPFFIQKGFQGLIPAGTPMYQMIPVKRDNWESEIQLFDKNQKIQSYGVYRSMFWHKKTYT